MISPAGTNNKAFSLLELMIVLVLLGVGAMMVLPAVERGIQNREARKAALGFAAAARELGTRARVTGVPQRLVVDQAHNSYRLPRDVEVSLPPHLSFAAVEGGEPLDHDLRRFSFFPSGASFGGRVEFASGVDSVAYVVRFHPLTGRVEVRRESAP